MCQSEKGTGEQIGDLGGLLRSLEGAPYPAYRDARGRYAMAQGLLEILRVQPDPFAPPSILRITVPSAMVGLEPARGRDARAGDSEASAEVELAAADFLARQVEEWLGDHPEVGAVVRIDPAGQQVLRRTAVSVRGDRVEILLGANLPARGRRIEGRRAATSLADGIPRLVDEALRKGSFDGSALKQHTASVEDHRALQVILAREGWIAFIADGSRLARRAGDDDAPMGPGSVPFMAPPTLAAEVKLPHAGRISGTALPAGIVLLCGGAFHGKSTLLRALAASVHPHIPGDGRERIAVEPTAMGVRAEDGRAVTDVDLTPFLHDLPDGSDPTSFRTQNASGATSQAAAVVEALASGARCLLIDEDTSATNFLLRDPWVARLLRPGQEPIVPLLSRLRGILGQRGVSVVLVVGGSGEAFRVADRALVMDSYRPVDESARVAEIGRTMGPGPDVPPATWGEGGRRLIPMPDRARAPRIRALSVRRILVGKSEIDLCASGALVHASQMRTLATILSAWLGGGFEALEVPSAAWDAARRLEIEGPGAFALHPRGDLAEVRFQEIMMLVDRLRILPREERES